MLSKIKLFVKSFGGSMVLGLGVLLGMGGTAFAAPVIDGYIFDPYTRVVESDYLKKNIIHTLDTGSKLYAGEMYQAEDANYLYFAFALVPMIGDNSYGANAIGWPPRGKNPGHTFKDLLLSDRAGVKLYNKTGSTTLEFFLDYFTDIRTNGYDSLGVRGGDGAMVTGNPDYIVSWSVSLDWNFHQASPTYPNKEKDSPPTDTYPTPSPSYPWIYEIIYEFKIDKAAFGTVGYGGITFQEVHVSPCKPGGVIPHPVPFLSAKKWANPAASSTVMADQSIQYIVEYKNELGEPLTNGIITDTVDPNLTNIVVYNGGTYDPVSRIVTWNLGTIPANQSGIVSFSGVVAPFPSATEIWNYATMTVTYGTRTYSVMTNRVVHFIGRVPDFSTSNKSSNPPSGSYVEPNQTIAYTIYYANTGEVNATNVVITDEIDANLTNVIPSDGGIYNSITRTITWNIGGVPVGGSGYVHFSADVISSASSADIYNRANITYDGGSRVTNQTVHHVGTPQLNITKTDSPDPVNAGDNLIYTLNISNIGQVGATNVVVTETYDANTSFISSTPAPDAATNNQWTFASLAPGETKVITITVKVASPLVSGTILTNKAQVVSAETPTPVSVTEPTTVTSKPVMTISKTDSPDPVEAGANLVYTLTIGNTGNEIANNAVVSETYDANVSFVSATPAPDATTNNQWTFTSLAPGETKVITITVKVASPLPNGTILTNKAQVVSAETPTPVSVTEPTTVSSKPVMTISKTDSPDPVEAGANLVYTLTIGNTGNEIANNAVVSEAYDANVIFVSATPAPDATTDNQWTFTSLAPGETKVITITVKVASPLPNGTILTNKAQVVSAETPTPVSVTEPTTVSSKPVMTISKTDSPDPVEAGANLIYTLTIGNTGNEIANNTVVTETYDANVTFVSSTPAPDATTNNQWTFASLAPGEIKVITITVKVASPLVSGTILTNKAQVVSAETPTPVSVTEPTTVSSKPVMTISKTDSPDPVEAGANLVYTLTIGNTGNEIANNAVVSETYDANVIFVSATPAPDAATNNQWTFASLAPGETKVITITVKVASPLPNGTILTNKAQVVSAETPTPVSVTEPTTVSSKPVMTISKTDSPDPVEAGANLVYTLTIGNTGNEIANNAVVSEAYDANVIFVSATPAPDATTDNQWTFTSLAPGETKVITITVKVASPLPNGTILTNKAQVVSAETPTPVSVTEPTTVSSKPVMTISKTDSPDPVEAGANLIYTLTIGNTGNEIANNTVVTETYDANVTFVSSTPAPDATTNNQWTFASLAPGEIKVITITVKVASPLPNGTILTNKAQMVSAETPTPVSVTEPTTVISKPILNITKSISNKTVVSKDVTNIGVITCAEVSSGSTATITTTETSGTLITYTISYSNTGNANATGVILTDTVPAGATFVSATDGGSYDSVTGKVIWNTGTINANTSGSVNMTVSLGDIN